MFIRHMIIEVVTATSMVETTVGGRWFWMYLIDDTEADSFFYANHGLVDQSNLTVTVGAGTSIKYRTDTGTTYNTVPTFGYIGSGTTHSVTVVGDDRFQINTAVRLTSAQELIHLRWR